MKNNNTITERSRSTPSLPGAIVEKSNGKLRYSGRKKSAYRIQRANSNLIVSAEELFNIVKKAGYKFIRKIPPGSAGSASGKYNTWILKIDKKEFAVVFGHGQNAGQKYEDEVINDLQNSRQADKTDKRSELYKALLRAFKIKTNQVKEIKKASNRAVKRPVTDKIQNVGKVISDIDIILKNGTVIYISLKNENGVTFANSGYNGAFDVIENSLYSLSDGMKIKASRHPLDDFIVNALGIDKKKAVIGINNYILGKPTSWDNQKFPTKFNEKKIKQYLASAYGYGYWYVRPAKQGGYQIVNLASPEDAMQRIGKINSVVVSYPYYAYKTVRRKEKGKPAKMVEVEKTSKQITAWIDTTTATYIVEVRNSQRGFIPNEIKVKIVGTKI